MISKEPKYGIVNWQTKAVRWCTKEEHDLHVERFNANPEEYWNWRNSNDPT